MTLSRFLPVLLVTTLSVGLTAPTAQAQLDVGSGVVIDNIDLEGIAFDPVTGLLTATGGTVDGTIAGLPFTTDITNFALDLIPGPGAPAGACSILSLELAPIDLDLLGLHVDTSPICLVITANPAGGLLGQLLCGLADGFGLTQNLDALLDGLTDVLGPVLTQALAQEAEAAEGLEDICDGECEILDLAIGPVELNLLGLNVLLDDCDEGPVQVCLSASEGEGLLGGLLCGLAGGGGILPNLGQLEDLVGTILDAIGGQTPTAQQADRIADRLVGQVDRALRDGALSGKELDKIAKTVGQVLK